MISKYKFYLMWFMAIIVLITIGACKKNDAEKTEYIFSGASYKELNSEIGCDSKYSKAKKRDIFNSRYKNHWMVWEGKVVLSDADSVSLNCDGKGIQDLTVTLANKNAGYDLMKGNYITVKFLMKSTGGCILPFGGEKATIYP